MMKSSEGRSRVIIVGCPLVGHMQPILDLGTMLQSKGFSITVAHTEFNSPNPFNHAGFSFLKMPDNLAGCDTSLYNLLAVIPAINNTCKETLRNHLIQMLENQERDGNVTCVIYDTLMYFADAVAKDLNIPSLLFRNNSAAYLQSLRASIELHAENTDLMPVCRLQEPVPNMEPLRFKDLPIPMHIRIPEMILQFQKMLTELRSALAFVCNTAEELEESAISEIQKMYQVPFFSVGPFNKMVPKAASLMEEDKSCIEWLDKHDPKSVIYVAFGSLAMLDDKDLAEIAWGLANSEQPFLWVIRPGSVKGSNWIEQLPEGFQEQIGERGRIAKWVPQKEVLSHRAIGAFFTHCGWNSVLESMCEGVPLLGRPWFGDQSVNGRYMTHVWKVGASLENSMDRETIEKSIRKIMVEDDENKEMRQNVLKWKAKLEASVQEDGSSRKSLDKLAEFIASLKANK